MTNPLLLRWVAMIGLFLPLFVLPLHLAAQDEATGTAASATSEVQEATPVAELSPAQRIERIEAKKTALTEEVEALQAALDEVEEVTDDVSVIEQRERLSILSNINITLNQQISELRRQQELRAQLQQAEIRAASGIKALEGESTSFLTLEQKQNQLRQKRNQLENIEQQIEVARNAVDQAQTNLNQRMNERGSMQNRQQNTKDETEKALLALELETAAVQVRAASESLILQRIELQNEELNQQVVQTQTEQLEKEVEYLQENATFPESELNQQLEIIEERRQTIDRQRTDLQERLDEAQQQYQVLLNREAGDPSLSEQLQAQRLERELYSTRISNLDTQQKLLSLRETIWQRRYRVFNQLAKQEEIRQWVNETQSAIADLNNEKESVSLTLTDYQADLTEVRTRLENQSNLSDIEQRWLPVQVENLQEIQDALMARLGEINLTINQLDKLNSELEQHVSALPYSERIDILMRYELFYGNTVRQVLITTSISLAVLFLLFFMRWSLRRISSRYLSDQDALIRSEIANTIHRTKLFFLLGVSIFIATAPIYGPYSLYFPEDSTVRDWIGRIVVFFVVLQLAIWTSYLARAWVMRYLMRRSNRDSASVGAMSIFNFLIQVLVWSTAVLMVLSNNGVDITALVTGLGVGGIAIALAVQRILGDLLSSLSIVLDKPFVTGDFIIFQDGAYLGTVENIGLKTTRIRSLSGEQIVCPNSSLLDSQIRNFKRMNERRVVFGLGVTYDTPHEKLRQIPKEIRAIIEELSIVRFDRAHFARYGAFSLDFEVVYYVLSSDYNVYMDVQQKINLDIYKRFEELEIEFAFPTQTIHLANPSDAAQRPDSYAGAPRGTIEPDL